MKLLVKDYTHQGDSLVGKLYIDGEFACYTLEDWPEGVNNRVKRGIYKILLRTEGTTHEHYKKLFGPWHIGMLHIQVPHRLWILIHIGQIALETLGCLLVGSSNSTPGKLDNSTAAYKRIYPKVSGAILKGEEVTIEYAPIPTDLK